MDTSTHLQAPVAQHSGDLGLVCFQLLDRLLSIGLRDDTHSGCMAAAIDLRHRAPLQGVEVSTQQVAHSLTCQAGS